MALIGFSGFEGQADNTDNRGYQNGTPTPSTSTVHGASTASIRTNPTTTNVASIAMGKANNAGNGVFTGSLGANSWVHIYFNFATKAASGSEPIYRQKSTGGFDNFLLALNSNGTLTAYKNNNGNNAWTAIATGTAVLVSGTWYKLSIATTNWSNSGGGNPGTFDYTIKVNDVTDLTGTGVSTINSASTDDVSFGKCEDFNGNSVDYFYDDYALDDAGFISGDYTVARMIPTANGTTMQWTGGTGSSNFAEVDEVPFNDADYVQSPTTTNRIALFAMTDLAISGAATIYGLNAYTRVRENTTVTSADFPRINSGASNQDGASQNLSTSISQQGQFAIVDPATGAAWTSTAIDAVQMGRVESNAVAMRCTQVFGAVMYSLPPSTAIKTWDGLAKASIKTVDGLAIASVKNINGLA